MSKVKGTVPFILAMLLVAGTVGGETSAVQKYRRLVERDPIDGPVLRKMCQLAEGEGRLGELVAYYTERLLEDPTDATAALMRGHLASYLSHGADARGFYAAAWKSAPDNWYAGYYHAKALVGSKQIDQARRLLAQSLSLAAGGRRKRMHLLLMASAAKQVRDEQGVREAVRELVAHEGGDVFARIEAARLLEDADLVDDAIAEHEKIIAASNDDPQRRAASLMALASLSSASGRFEKAADACRRALALLSPDNAQRPQIVARRLQIYRDHGRVEELIAEYESLLEDHPLDASARLEFARLLRREGRFTTSLAHYERLAEHSRSDLSVLREGAALAARGGDAGKLAHFARLLQEARPTRSADWVLAIDCFRRAGDVTSAAACLQSARESLGSRPERLLELAKLCATRRFSDEATSIFAELIADANAGPNVFVECARVQIELRDAEGAQRTLASMMDRFDDNVDALALAGRIARRHGFDAAGLRACERVSELATDRWDLLAECARAFETMERDERAMALWWTIARKADTGELRGEAEKEIVSAAQRAESLGDFQRDLQQTVAADPKDLAASIILARAMLQDANATGAADIFARLWEEHPRMIRLARLLEEAHADAGNYADAIATALALVRIDAARRVSHYERAIGHALVQQDRAGAAALIDRLIASAPDSAHAHSVAAAAFERLGDSQRALDGARMAAQLGNDRRYLQRFAETLESQDALVEAVSIYERIFREEDDPAAALSSARKLVELSIVTARTERVETLFHRRLRANRESVRAYEPLVWLFERLGRTAEIVAVVEQACRYAGGPSEVVRFLCDNARHMAQSKTALSFARDLQRSRALTSPGDQLSLAAFLLSADKNALARDVVEDAVAEGSMDERFEFLFLAGSLFAGTGDFDTAQAFLDRALRIEDGNLPVRATSAMLKQRTGNHAEAAEELLTVCDSVLSPRGRERFRTERARLASRTPPGLTDRAGVPAVPSAASDRELADFFLTRLVGAAKAAGMTDELVTRLEARLGEAPDEADYLILEALITKDGDAEKLIQLYRKADGAFPNNPRWRGQLARVAGRARNAEGLVQVLTRSVQGRAGPTAKELDAALDLLIKAKDSAKLEDFLGTYQGRQKADVYMALSRRCEAAGLPSQAVDAISEAIRLQPPSLESESLRAAAFGMMLKAARRDEAIAVVHEAINEWSASSGALNTLLPTWRSFFKTTVSNLTPRERDEIVVKVRTLLASAPNEHARLVVAASLEYAGQRADAINLYIAAAEALPTDIYFQKAVIQILEDNNAMSRIGSVVDAYFDHEDGAVQRKNFCRSLVGRLNGVKLPPETIQRVQTALLFPLGGNVPAPDLLQMARYYESLQEHDKALALLEKHYGELLDPPGRDLAAVLKQMLGILARKGDRKGAREAVGSFLEQSHRVESNHPASYSARRGVMIRFLGVAFQRRANAITGAVREEVRLRATRQDLTLRQRLDLAFLAEKLSMTAEQLALLSELASELPRDDALQMVYFDALMDAKRTDRAVRLGERLLRRSIPGNWELLSQIANLHVAASDTAALRRLYRMLSRSHADAQSFKVISAALLSAGLSKDGVDAFKTYARLAKTPGAAGGWDLDRQVAALQRRLGQHDAAVATIERAVTELETSTDPGEGAPYLYQELVSCHHAAGALDALAARYEDRVRAVGDDVVALDVLVMIESRRGRRDEVLRLRRALVELDGDKMLRMTQLASALRDVRKFTEAAALYLKMSKDADAQRSTGFVIEAARCLADAGRVDEASGLVDDLLEKTAAETPALFPVTAGRAAEFFAAAGRPERRLACLKRAVEFQDYTNLTLLLDCIAAMLADGGTADAADLVIKALPRFDSRDDQLRDLAEPFLSLDDEELVAVGARLLSVTQEAPTRTAVKAIVRPLARDLLRRGRTEDARKLAEGLSPQAGRGVASLGLLKDIAVAQNRRDDALRLWDKLVLQEGPVNSERHLADLAKQHVAWGETDQAVVAFERAYAQRSDPGVLLSAAREMAKAGLTGKAKDYCRRLIDESPDHLDGIRELFDLCRRAGQDDEATAMVDRLMDTSSDPATLRLAAALNGRLGRPAAVAEALQKSLERDPGNADALERLATSLVAQGRREEASATLERLDAAIGDDARKREVVIQKRIALYRESGHLDGAIARERSSLQEHEEDLADSALRIAGSLEKRGRLSDAIAYYSRALVFAKGEDGDRIRFLISGLQGRLERGEI